MGLDTTKGIIFFMKDLGFRLLKNGDYLNAKEFRSSKMLNSVLVYKGHFHVLRYYGYHNKNYCLVSGF